MHKYEQLANALREGITKSIYRPGDRLPGVRKLSRQFQVSIATAVAAYRSLELQGVVEARPRSGFFVSDRPQRAIAEPAPSTPGNQPSPVTGQELVLRLVKAANNPRIVQLGAAVPDPVFLPVRMLAKAQAQALRSAPARISGYEFPPGIPELRQQIARRMAQAGCVLSPDEILVTNGCQEALTLALKAVTAPGDVVAIESPTFYGLLQVIEMLGLNALEIPTHPREGVSLKALQLALEQWPVKACILVPNYSNPLGYCMSSERKSALVGLLERHHIPLIEDDVYGDLGFRDPRPSPAKAFSRDGNVIYCSSFSKTLAPGLRVGWIAAGGHLERVEYLKYVTNLATPTLSQVAIASLLASGGYDRYLQQARSQYSRAVSTMIDAVGALFPAETKVTHPNGGFVIWVELPERVDSFQLARRALEKGISVAPGPIFSATGKYRNFIRLSCACRWDRRVERALATLAAMM